MTPPIWIDDHGRQLPRRPCHRCGAPTSIRRMALLDVKRNGRRCLAPILRRLLQTEVVFVAPLRVEGRLLRRIEGALAAHVKSCVSPAPPNSSPVGYPSVPHLQPVCRLGGAEEPHEEWPR